MVRRRTHDCCCPLTRVRLTALLRLAAAHCAAWLRNATQSQQIALMAALQTLINHTTLELYPSITEHIFDVATILSDNITDDVRNQIARIELGSCTDSERMHFISGTLAPADGWLMLTKPINHQINPHPSQPSTPLTAQNISSPYQSPQTTSSTPATPQHRYFNQQQQQRQQPQQSPQIQQSRTYAQYPQHGMQPNRQLPAQLQRTPSFQSSPSSLQQMQHMQHLHGLAQQRASQPSPVQTQRPTSAVGSNPAGGSASNAALPNKLQTSYANHHRDSRQYPFVQPRWEILAESSGNPNLNETAINLSLFGARRV
jgi:mediator of RNA polymerase II transcription subunit 12